MHGKYHPLFFFYFSLHAILMRIFRHVYAMDVCRGGFAE
jgi:hypothetical protein